MKAWLSSLLLFAVNVVTADIKQLPYCKEDISENVSSDKPPRSLVFVSTLDGKLTALDAAQGGQKRWTLDFKQELLSSNIHRRDLNNNGQWVRLIPSLNGGLYKFDGENLEAVPVSVDQLLQSSFRYSDDLIFSGGKETKTYGISSSTGRIIYECKMSSCSNATDGDSLLEDDVLIVRRHQHTVRAGEPRTGMERWNFSVGQHDLTIIPRVNSNCNKEVPTVNLDIEIRAIIPEGVITTFSKNNPSKKLWEYKFDSPIVSVWREDQVFDNGEMIPLKEINLFESTQLDSEMVTEYSLSPGIYIGMHERQLYVQENPKFFKKIEFSSTKSELVRYPWRPYPAIEFSNDVGNDINKDIPIEMSDVLSTTALSVLYNSEYINGNGFYLYSKEQMQIEGENQCNGTGPKHVLHESGDVPPDIELEEEDDTPVQVIIVSLWYWWKEVLIISITTAILLNFMLTQRLLNATAETKDAMLPPLIVERHVVDPKNEPRKSQSEDGENFQSRYLTDYEPLDCLGKGGYGVVFEARNKIDDCNYAIKRIALPNSRYSRERVMREVKALAKLDHHNIVRYFNAWLECPPSAWLEEHDRQWLCNKKFPNSGFASESSAVDTSVHIDVPPSDPSSIDSACEAYELNKNNDDSFIVFEAHTDDEEEEENQEEAYNTHSVQLSITDSSKSKSTVDDSSIVFEEPSKDLTERKSQLNLDLRKRKDSNKSSTKMFLYIQMQLCQRLSLREWLKAQRAPRDIFKVLNIFQQIIDAVEYVHLQGLIHRDLKPSNIFFAFDNKVKIGDFGLVTAMTEGINGVHTPCSADEKKMFKNHTARVGTHLYMSPEQVNGQNYNYKVDIYSLGIILFELLTPFSTEMERVIALTNLRKSIFPDNFASQFPAEFELLKMMLDSNPEKRPTTLGIKARPPLLRNEVLNGFNSNESNDSKWHFELPQISRHSSVTNSSGSDSWDNIC